MFSRTTIRTVLATVAAAVALTTAVGGPAQAAPGGALTPVPSLDTARYLGTWWQQAAIPGFYSIRCARDTHATYSLISATTIKVDNRCISPTGMPDGVVGRADLADKKTGAQFVVSFPGVPNTIDPQNHPNYIVAWVADDERPGRAYQYAIVGDPTRLSGFALSRDRVISTAQLLRLRSEVEKLGFNPCLFLVSPTTGGRSDYTPLCLVS
ncbi:lipocalin family protein [Gordonia sp. TBRC 11910]|uniref:Lipocalin family protein n=1 Tax=Gordonia asplenii TaxID=2725283 RepID=A0A848KTN2_9ACTN|nr:lipocalin family protein [Gordonia asplenii]NMO01850.1 lipocalin family protein [Gordonia asplenii]